MGKSVISFLLLTCLVGIDGLTSNRCVGESIGTPDDADYLVFSQEWPQTVCIDAKITKEHTCSIPKNVTTWGVHGIWPNKFHTTCPNYCNTSSSFDPAAIEAIYSDLLMLWPNLYTDSPLNEFWMHEWCKHGTCAVNIPSLRGEKNYFSMGLQLHDKFNLKKIFGAMKINPGTQTYEYTDVTTALGKAFHEEGYKMSCVYDKSTKTQYLMQVEICVDKSFEPISCNSPGKLDVTNSQCRPQTSAHQSINDVYMMSQKLNQAETCRDTEMIAYPTIVHS